MSRLRYGLARVQFLAVREEAQALMAQGHTCAYVYEQLKQSGKISMCFGAFRRYLTPGEKKRKTGKSMGSGKAVAGVNAPEQLPAMPASDLPHHGTLPASNSQPARDVQTLGGQNAAENPANRAEPPDTANPAIQVSDQQEKPRRTPPRRIGGRQNRQFGGDFNYDGIGVNQEDK